MHAASGQIGDERVTQGVEVRDATIGVLVLEEVRPLAFELLF